ncbi:hypothetical protein B0T18DRAFT_227493 [Schizothecium vesticola]|uniref:Uncharacterized protein n=1 Tax=Schizothecium vesticola TaxID=314040 RepID=A0AA40EL17_9PEZI|nr:hypothetical protein B0T18DRAFT_227493 [Schizothecium vesticola]
MKLLVLVLQAVSVTALPLNVVPPPSEARFDSVSQHASPLVSPDTPPPHHHQTGAPSPLQKRDTHPHPTQEELCHVLAQLFAIQVQVAVLVPTVLVPTPSPSGILDNLLGGLFGVLPTLSQAIDLVHPTLDNIISTVDQVLAIPFVYTIPAFIPIITTTTINVPLSIIYDPFPTVGPSLAADLLALARLTNPVAILDVVADLVASVRSPLLGGGVLPVLVPVYPVLGVVPVLVTTVVTQTDGGTASSTVTTVEPLPTDPTGRVAPITALIPGLLPGGALPTIGVSAGGGPGGVTLAASVQIPGGLGLGLGLTVALPSAVPTGRPPAVMRGGSAAVTGQPGQPTASIALLTILSVAMPAASQPSPGLPGLPLPTLPPVVSVPSQPTPSVALPTLPAVSLPPLAVPNIILPTLPAVSIPAVALPSVAVPRVSLAVPGVSPPTPQVFRRCQSPALRHPLRQDCPSHHRPRCPPSRLSRPPGSHLPLSVLATRRP